MFLIYKIFSFIINIVPQSLVKYILYATSRLIYLIDIKHNKISMANLNFAFKNTKTQEEKKQIIKNSYFNLLLNLHQFITIKNTSLKNMNDMIELVDEHYIKDAIKNNNKIILATVHYGNWELAIPYVSLKFRPISVISKAIKNIHLNNELTKVRKAHNLEMFEKHGAAKKMIKALKDNRIIAMAVDQSISKEDASTVKFFNRDVTQTDSPIRLASKLEAIIIPFIFINLPKNRYKAIFFKPYEIEKNISETKILDYSQKISNIFEKQIRINPNQWFWQHKRFKEFNQTIYE
jgi:KDO2-lipid IV(A) lauroyltransferase